MTDHQETRPIDKIRQASRDQRRSIEVEGWGLELFFRPLTTADIEAVDASMRDDGKAPEEHRQDRRIRLLVEKAELEDGSRAFRPGDIHHLKQEADYVVLQRVIGFMYKAAVPTVEAGKDESEGTETSDSD